ncbi:MAG: amidohydrolase family protein [Planctomycetes bacterium]|nr:amidohydrolase family protein [Planctomycetota bacterium]
MKCRVTPGAGDSRPATGLRRVAAWVVAVASLAAAADASAAASLVAVKAHKIFVGDGRVIENGIIVIQDGKVLSVGADVAVPEGATVIEIQQGCATPGLIDANARIDSDEVAASRGIRIDYGEQSVDATAPGAVEGEEPIVAFSDNNVAVSENEPLHVDDDEELPPPLVSGVQPNSVVTDQRSEVVPYIRVLDALDLEHRDFERLVRGGVTTVYVSPDASAVIGCRGAVVRTAGPVAGRVLVPMAAVKATIGSEPSSLGTNNSAPSRGSASIYARRPNSRMGLVWVFRKAFYDAARQRDGLPVYGADTASPEALAVVLEILEGRVPLRIQARIQRDILAAVRLANEFNVKFTLEEATEAYLTIDELKDAGVPVIFGPIYERPTGIRARGGEADKSRFHTFRSLLEAGIPTALSAQDLREEDGLARQAMYAQRFGVGFDDALRAVTLTPARMVGLEEQLGTLESGKRADLVLWSGTPLAATSVPLVVLIDGEIVLDRR